MGTRTPSDEEGRRGQILRAAADSFAELGYLGTSLNHICDGAGIAKPTLYHYFSAKDQILFEVMFRYIDALLAAAEMPERRKLSPPDRLLELMKDIVGSLDTSRGPVRCFYENAVEFLPPELRERVDEIVERYAQQIDCVLVSGRDAGLFAFEDVQMTRRAIYALCAWPFVWYRPGGSVTTEQIATSAWNIVMSGIGSTKR